jgi:hypothetical protein
MGARMFAGAPPTPTRLNSGMAGFPEYHHVHVKQKNIVKS